jgi:hypothetical protein
MNWRELYGILAFQGVKLVKQAFATIVLTF